MRKIIVLLLTLLLMLSFTACDTASEPAMAEEVPEEQTDAEEYPEDDEQEEDNDDILDEEEEEEEPEGNPGQADSSRDVQADDPSIVLIREMFHAYIEALLTDPASQDIFADAVMQLFLNDAEQFVEAMYFELQEVGHLEEILILLGSSISADRPAYEAPLAEIDGLSLTGDRAQIRTWIHANIDHFTE